MEKAERSGRCRKKRVEEKQVERVRQSLLRETQKAGGGGRGSRNTEMKKVKSLGKRQEGNKKICQHETSYTGKNKY